jgi:hypothetical protein
MKRLLALSVIALATAGCSRRNTPPDPIPHGPTAAVRLPSTPTASAVTASPPPRTIAFPGGTALVEVEGITEHVVVTGTDGSLRSESWCTAETGTYDALVALFERLQVAVTSHDARSVARLLRFPFRVNDKKAVKMVATPDEFLRRYDKILVEPIVAEIRIAQPRALYCHNSAAMLGKGVIWARTERGIALAYVLNK